MPSATLAGTIRYLGSGPRILYDNTKLAVEECCVSLPVRGPVRPPRQGQLEGLVGYNFLVYRPSRASMPAYLERRCLERMDAQLRGHTETIGQRMERDLDALLPLPAVPYDACDKQSGRVSSLSLVRYRTSDYSVPVAYGHRDVLVRGYVDQVVISCGTEVIARHPRSYERDDFVYVPAALGTEAGSPGSGRSATGMEPLRGVRDASAGSPHGTQGQA